MATRTEKRNGLNAVVVEMRQELARKIAAHAPARGENRTAVPGLALYRRTRPTPCFRAIYEPSLTVFAQGRKRINLSGTVYLCNASSFLLSSIDIPVESQITEASEQVPMLTMNLQLDMPIVREVLSREDLPEPLTAGQRHGLAVGVTTAGLLAACSRLIDLLDAPEDIPFLSHLIHREILYRVLRTPQGERLRAIATAGDLSYRTARAIAWLRANYAKPLRIDELATRACKSSPFSKFSTVSSLNTRHTGAMRHSRRLRAAAPLLPKTSPCRSSPATNKGEPAQLRYPRQPRCPPCQAPRRPHHPASP
ncbi:MAG: AraC family transcriptional regulator [Terracidiphilus sp.]